MINATQNDEEILACFDILKQLRPHIDKKNFLNTIKSMQSEGYQLTYLSEQGNIKAVMGFKISTNLFLGKHLYIEDLVTDESQRSFNFGKQLMDWAYQTALAAQCVAIHLDSGVQRHRAHKFYLNNDMDIACYHFLRKIDH